MCRARCISIDDDGRISLLNKAARRLLGGARSEALPGHGDSFAADIAALRPGERGSTRL